MSLCLISVKCLIAGQHIPHLTQHICCLQLSTSEPQQLPMSTPPLPPSALGTALIQPFFQNEEMARFLGYNGSQSSNQHDSPSLYLSPHGTTMVAQMSVAQVSRNGSHAQHQPTYPVQQRPVLPPAHVSAAQPSTTAPSTPLTPTSLPMLANTGPAQHAAPQSSPATAQLTRVPLSPFMADAEHSYASPLANRPPAQMAWEAFGNSNTGQANIPTMSHLRKFSHTHSSYINPCETYAADLFMSSVCVMNMCICAPL